MSRQAGKSRNPAAKRQTRTLAKGEHSLEKQAHDLQHKADHILADSANHSSLLSSQDTSDIRTSVEQLQLQTGRLTAMNKEVRSKQLESVEEQSGHSSSEGEEEEDTHSKIGSMDTMPYVNTLSSPFTTSLNGKSPSQMDQPPVQRFHTTPPVNPQFVLNPPTAIPCPTFPRCQMTQ